MISGPLPGSGPADEATKQLEFELEAAWKKLSARHAQCERTYIALLRAQAESSQSSGFAFAEWQSANAQFASARHEYERLDRSLTAASRAAVAPALKPGST